MPLQSDQIQSGDGGQFKFAVIAGTSGSQCGYTGSGRVCKVICQAVGTSGGGTIYDGTDSTGTAIFVGPTNPTVGQVFNIQVPVSTGIYYLGVTTVTGAYLITYNKAGSNGQA